ncbi:alpha/beta fold hydrolase [Psychromarinibacter sp. C21-152]|uniref:Alpha/beta fold hydrolase n=1 Tax=Psychromarinibacter sediminicola TaxID=3033385 RepID=A0AAE3NWS2_9RHOB|nr:alpha/beta fold hydrolase [Psychromarinibacter sediminicola]MDF0603104.1 alpha/beta fold hydrolase [Psychromarinibacter sediminicola]
MEPVVLVPGPQAEGTSWLPLCQRIVGAHPLVVPFGHRRADTMAAMANAVLHQSPTRFHLVGWSMGGYIAFEILRRAPERLLSLTLISTTAAPESEAARQGRQETLDLASIDGMRRYQAANLEKCLLPPGLAGG